MSTDCRPSLADIESVVCAHYGVSKIDLRSLRRTKDLIEPRHILFYVASERTRHSLPAIGRYMHRDHTSVLNGRRKIAQRVISDPELASHIAGIEMAAMTLAHMRIKQQLSIQQAPTPLELAHRVVSQGQRAAIMTTPNQIIELCEALIAASRTSDQELISDEAAPTIQEATTLVLMEELVDLHLKYLENPDMANRVMRDEAVECLRHPERQDHPLVSQIVAAFVYLIKTEFTVAEGIATMRFNELMDEAVKWVESEKKTVGETQ